MNFLKLLATIVAILITSGIVAQKSEHEQAGDELYRVFAYRGAIEKYEASAVLSTEGKRRLAMSHAKIGNYSQAERVYSSLVTMPDCITEDLYEYALVLRSNNKYEEAQGWMDKYTQRAGDTKRTRSNTQNRDLLEKLLMDQGNYKLTNLGLNTPGQEFAPVFYGDKLVFSAAATNIQIIERTYVSTNERFLDLYVLDSGDYNSSERVAFKRKFNKKFHEGVASFTADGKRMFFTSNSQSEKGKEGEFNLEIYWSDLDERGRWSDPQAFPFNDPNYSLGQPSVNPNGTILYFSSNRPGGFGGVDLWSSTLSSDGKWGSPVNLGPTVNTESDELFPFIHADENLLFFTSNGLMGLGGFDVFVAVIGEGAPGSPKNLGAPVNSSADDLSFVLSKDMKHGYLASNRYGGKGDDDIWAVELVKPIDISPEQTISGTVQRRSGAPINEAEVSLVDASNNILQTVITDPSGKYHFRVPKAESFTLRAIATDYKTTEKLVVTEKGSDFVDLPLVLSAAKTVEIVDTLVVASTNNEITDDRASDLESKKDVTKSGLTAGIITSGVPAKKEDEKSSRNSPQNSVENKQSQVSTVSSSSTVIPLPASGTVMKSVYFAFNSSYFNVDDKRMLDSIVGVLQKNPNMSIELRSYTDCRADEAYNQMLSEKRLDRVMTYVRERVKNPYRVRGIAMGELPTGTGCDCDSKETTCDEVILQRSRRVDIIVVKR